MTNHCLELEKDVKIWSDPSLKNLSNFNLNKNEPVHRWFCFKEGFSHQLVKNIFSEFGIDSSKSVLDCFSGSSTTVITAQHMGIDAIGVEINPFFRFMGEIKRENGYDPEKLKYYRTRIIGNIEKAKIEDSEFTSFKRCFSSYMLSRIIAYKNEILRIRKEKYRKLMLFVLASIIEDLSYVKKDGKGLKFVAKNRQNIKKLFSNKIDEIIEDIKYKHKNKIKDLGRIIYGDARKMNFLTDKQFDFCIFSPPYLNSFDYTEVYKLELWLSGFVKTNKEFKKLSRQTLRSHTTASFNNIDENNLDIIRIIKDVSRKKSHIWNRNIPLMIEAYFSDMKNVFLELNRVLKSKSYCVFVIGNSSYAGVAIPTDILLGKMAEECGFELKEIRIIRDLRTSPQQMRMFRKNKRYLRESLVVLQKI